MKELIFTLGLPGCGKSTYINSNYTNIFDYREWSLSGISLDAYCTNMLSVYENDNKIVVIAADEIKPFLPGYTNEHPEEVHERSVQMAKDMVYTLIVSSKYNGRILMDGGGINNNYTYDIIKYAKDHGVKVTCIKFDTPIKVCLERISKRDRKVPEKVVYEKYKIMNRCIERYRPMVDDIIDVLYYKNKYIMLDMDGTICGYVNAKSDYDGNVDFVNDKIFLSLNPVWHIINFVKQQYDMENVYICTACPNIIAWQEKNEWLDKYFPEVKKENRLFCGNKDWKYVFVEQFAEHQGWERNEVVLVDDYHHTIDKCQEIGINCIHPSNIEALLR